MSAGVASSLGRIRITILLPYKFVECAVDGIGYVDFAFRADSNEMRFAEFAKPFTRLADCGKNLTVQIHLQQLAGEAIDHIDVLLADVERAGKSGVFQLLYEISVLIENLNARVRDRLPIAVLWRRWRFRAQR